MEEKENMLMPVPMVATLEVASAEQPAILGESLCSLEQKGGWVINMVVKQENGLSDIADVMYDDQGHTVVKWRDGSITVVQCERGTEFNKEMGILMCYAKKHFGSTTNYIDFIKKFTKE